jgi:DNA-directed RNA polymerase specialized sigma24 family protein
MVASVVDPKDSEIIHLAPSQRPLSAHALVRLKETIRQELRRQIQLTLQRAADRPRAGAVRQTLLQVFGPDRSVSERRLFFLFAAPLVRSVLLEEVRIMNRGAFNGFDASALEVALRRLEKIAPRQARMIDLHYFAGLTLHETADLLGLTERALDRELRFIKAWLVNGSHPDGIAERR